MIRSDSKVIKTGNYVFQMVVVRDSPIIDILRKYEKEDSRIRVVYTKKQMHISDNTNEALKIATGDFIAFGDHDDLLATEMRFMNV